MATAVATPRLTAKQEHYCQLRAIHGLNETEAYLLSYEGDKTVRPALYVRASEVEHNRKVSVRIAELTAEINQPIISKAIAAINERKEHATLKMRTAESDETQLRANRLLGEYEKELGSGSNPIVAGDTYNIQITQVTNQLTLLMAEADARFPGLLDWYQERLKALGEGQGK